MLITFAEKPLTGLVFSALLVGIATYFGEPFIFDPIVLLSIAAIGLHFRRNTDLFTICSVLVAEKAFEELMWRLFEYSLWFKSITYPIIFILCMILSRAWLRVYLAGFLSLAIVSELYWYTTNYAAPDIIWGCFMLTEVVALRRFFKMRVFWMIELNPRLDVKPIFLDSQLIFVASMYIVNYSLLVFEYYIRHIFGLKEVTHFYHLFPYIGSAIAIFSLFLIIIQSIAHLRGVELDA